MSLRSLLPGLRKIRVLYVDDPSRKGSETREALARTERNAISAFWTRASQLCPSHPSDHATDAPCPACPFELAFFSYFPQACYSLLQGNDYDAFLVDIHADNVPANIWDDAAALKLNAEGKQIMVFESLSPEEVIGSGLTKTREQQMEQLAFNAAYSVEQWLLEHPEWFASAAAASTVASGDSASPVAAAPAN